MKYYTQHPKYFEDHNEIQHYIYTGKLDDYETTYHGKTEKMEFVEISEEEARKIMLDGIKGAKQLQGHNLMGVSESFYDPYYLVRQMIKEQHINVDELLTETLFWMIETANFASKCFY